MTDPAPPRPPRAELNADDEWADERYDHADLANRVLTREHVVRCTFTACRMTGFEVPDGSLTDVAFTDCRLDLGALRLTSCSRVAFTDCVLTELDLYESRLQDVLFERCDLTGADFSAVRCSRVALRGCTLDGVRGTDGLRGVQVAWDDVLALAPSLAADAGLIVREE